MINANIYTHVLSTSIANYTNVCAMGKYGNHVVVSLSRLGVGVDTQI